MKTAGIQTIALLAAAALASAACGGSSSSSSDPVAGAAPEINQVKTTKLTSKDGHDITLSYSAKQIQVDGSSTTHTATNVSIRVDNVSANNSVRAVVIDDCSEFGTPRFQLVDTCDLAKNKDGTFEGKLGTCAQTQKADNVADHFPDILVDYSSVNGDDLYCSQELAVVIDGQWLTDPINGTHNFKFRLPNQ